MLRTKHTICSLLVAFFIFLAFGSSENKNNGNETTSTQEQTNRSGLVKSGEVLKTSYFDVIVNGVELQTSVNTGNPYTNLKEEQGNLYIVVNATFKNTDTESRMISEGSIFINYNGKDYEFDKTESILLEGWGATLEQINPLTSKTTNLVWKIPAEISGEAIWKPGRSDSGQGIILGNLGDSSEEEKEGTVNMRIENKEFVGQEKATFDVRLSGEANEKQIEGMAKYFLEDFPNYERYFITYYLPNQKIGEGAWATSHIENGKIDVRILKLQE